MEELDNMNTKERFMNALRLQPVDRPPVAAVVTGITVDMMEKLITMLTNWRH